MESKSIHTATVRRGGGGGGGRGGGGGGGGGEVEGVGYRVDQL